ncbi:MAG: TIGR03905 family TSCPD domain-containing protein [Acutalibacteraceae bacterium]|nr:TIGR03905 family TSCPD domain-containing protein [Acutalibacteraceae bacterium]
MKFTYTTSGVCSKSIDIEVENGVVKGVSFLGGCNGNLKGIGELVKGMSIDDVIAKLENIKCGFKNTSCPAQLANALKEYKNGQV